ncbi:MAG: hypothetical protein UR39_C0006G0010 [Candidatus Woesebacteria bacterium GW2011_GWA1_33_30]|uniref:Uncharacterized protein n=1 Tax=Candidatus Woesebacteria bacterium GW2011_GWA2_33_28 TaxID=1618561 RepID=A0A0G0C707_9BACT|nr:MAG: hypothetical protein UR38_C0006G0043 [Candidatus Woesebacteria bacterium GW2011_GWA2_33_28]KKP47854.1 MAG: hypothetical protein UR39_C0006G0010 [Candidatus Woesebacteria bacterium GW2011_GWA1_33_30]KKP49297.1 MAG: hypothetical protein UR40_C0007G0010 [Microgenomates group bacterium GW2011_GWC1_33_32]KKP52007.1 MAG: hypothetical protein UR44_C0005G0010 [Candidatus Woesebacteria bacterium GW2011_GWB1_33_38]KKP57519.1 MAG: hypothetical protein UR48_C0015G0010 [Microgenomates group bacteriu
MEQNKGIPDSKYSETFDKLSGLSIKANDINDLRIKIEPLMHKIGIEPGMHEGKSLDANSNLMMIPHINGSLVRYIN